MITEEDILDLIEVNDVVRIFNEVAVIVKINCCCNYDMWGHHFHAGSYICNYDINKSGPTHTSKISELFKRKGKDYIRFAHRKNGRLILDKEVLE